MNPYAKFLGNRNPLDVIGATSGRLKALLDELGPGKADRAPAPGKWSAREILCHLADCEIVFAFRLRQALAEPHHVIQPFDQDLWASEYRVYDAGSALAVFTAVRGWNRALVGSVPPERMSKAITHPERGEMTFRTVIETMAGHDLNHLAQLDALAA